MMLLALACEAVDTRQSVRQVFHNPHRRLVWLKRTAIHERFFSYILQAEDEEILQQLHSYRERLFFARGLA